MKKNIVRVLSAVALVALTASCNKQQSKMDDQPAGGADAEQVGMKIAYVEVDSLTEHYEFAKVMKDSLEKMSANATNVLAEKDRQLERSYNNIQQKLQNNGFASEDQYKTAVAAFQREQNNRAALEQRLSSELAQKQADFLTALQDSLDNFLELYNQDKKYDLILSRAAVLYGNKAFDITQDVVNGLNNRYKK